MENTRIKIVTFLILAIIQLNETFGEKMGSTNSSSTNETTTTNPISEDHHQLHDHHQDEESYPENDSLGHQTNFKTLNERLAEVDYVLLLFLLFVTVFALMLYFLLKWGANWREKRHYDVKAKDEGVKSQQPPPPIITIEDRSD